MAIYDFFLSRNNGPTLANYIGHKGRLFYDDATGEIRISNGVTPGGLPIPISIATTSTVGGIKPGAGFLVSNTGTLTLNAGPSFYLDGSNVFRLRPGTADLIGGIKAGEGVNIASDGTLAINLDDVEAFSFSDFTATVGEYTDETEYALLSVVKADEDIVIASNGTGSVCVVGTFHVHATDGSVTGSLENGPVFTISADGQVKMYVPDVDTAEGAIEIIGSSTGGSVTPGQPGTMLHITGQPSEQTRVYIDGNGNYASIIGRRWNGTISGGRTQVLAGEDILRINATAQTDTEMPGVAAAQIRFRASENHTDTAQGSTIEFLVTRNGTSATLRETGLIIDNTGIEIPGPDSGVVFNGNTSGTIRLQPAAIAGTNTITLPAATGSTVIAAADNTVTGVLAGTLSIDPDTINKNSSSTQTFALTGLTTNHKVVIMPQAALPNDLVITAAWASAVNTLSIQFKNFGGGVDPDAFDIAYWAWI